MLGMPSRCYGFNKRSAEAQRTQRERGILVVGRFARFLAWQCGAGGGDSRFELSTQEARRVLPAQVSRADAISRRIWGCCRGWKPVSDWLRAALQQIASAYIVKLDSRLRRAFSSWQLDLRNGY